MKAADFIGALFLARDVAHSAHLSTRSFSKHMALDAFYHEVVALADKFAEAYQGRAGLIGPIPLQGAKKAGNIADFLQDSLKSIEQGRFSVCAKDDSALQNIIDEIVGLYLATIYKIKNLA